MCVTDAHNSAVGLAVSGLGLKVVTRKERENTMASLFSVSECSFRSDTIVNVSIWNGVEQIAAMSTNTIDENEKEVNSVHFVAEDVRVPIMQ
jgi:hypothetical protein